MREICKDVEYNPSWVVKDALAGIARARQPGYAFISDHILLEVLHYSPESLNLYAALAHYSQSQAVQP